MSSDNLAPPPYVSPPKYTPIATSKEQSASTTASQVDIVQLNGSDPIYPISRPHRLPAEPAAAVTANTRNDDPVVATRSLRTAVGGQEIAVALHPPGTCSTSSSSLPMTVESDDRRDPDVELTRTTMRLHGGDVELEIGVGAYPWEIEARPRVLARQPQRQCRTCRNILQLIGLLVLLGGFAVIIIGNIVLAAIDVNDYNNGNLTKQVYAMRSAWGWKFDGVMLLSSAAAQLLNYTLWWTERDPEWRKNCSFMVVIGVVCDCLLAVLFVVYWVLIGEWAVERGLT